MIRSHFICQLYDKLWLLGHAAIIVVNQADQLHRQLYHSFHDFPKDELLKSWVRLIRRDEEPLILSSQARLSVVVKMLQQPGFLKKHTQILVSLKV